MLSTLPPNPLALTRLSDRVARLEKVLLVALVAALVGLILFNVVTRTAGVAIYWVDELAIYTMIWLVFCGAGHTVRLRRHVQVTLLLTVLPERSRHAVEIGIDLLVWAFCLFCIWLVWIWYDPLVLAAAGFDKDAFSAETFNFIYDEPTLTIGIRKYWVWLVMPWFALTASVHAGANVADGLAGSTLREAA